jgi:hypothetical protein
MEREKRLFNGQPIELGGQREKPAGLILPQHDLDRLHKDQLEAEAKKRQEEEQRVYDQMVNSPEAMRGVIQECINRGRVRLSMDLDLLTDEQVKKTFIHLWGQASVGKPTVTEINI